MSKAMYQTIEPKKPDFKDSKALIPYIAVFVGFLLVVLSVFLPLYKEKDFGTSESFSTFKLATNFVDDISDFIDMTKAESVPGVDLSELTTSLFIQCLIDLICVAACIVTLIYVIKAILIFIKKNRLPCGGVAGIVSLEVIALVIYMLLLAGTVSFGGETFGSEVGIGAFVMAAGLMITSLGSKFLNNYVNKKPIKDMILSLSLILVASVLFIVTLIVMPFGIEAEGRYLNVRNVLDYDSNTTCLVSIFLGAFSFLLLVIYEMGAVSPSIFADNDELFLGRRQLGANNRPIDYSSRIAEMIAAFVLAVVTCVCVKVGVNALNKGTNVYKVSSGLTVVLIVACVCLAASIAIKVVLKESKTEQI